MKARGREGRIIRCIVAVVLGVALAGLLGVAEPADLPVTTLGLLESTVSSFSPDLGYLALSERSVVFLVSTEDWATLFTLESHTSQITSMAFSLDGELLATASADATVRLWDTSTGEEALEPIHHESPVSVLQFSLDSLLLVCGDQTGYLSVWDLRTGTRISHWQAHMDEVLSLAVSADSSVIASGSTDGVLRLWNTNDSAELRSINAHSSTVKSLAFSPDGNSLASAGWNDGTVKLWDVSSGWEIREFGEHAGAVSSVAFGPDGRSIAAGVWEWHSFRGSVGKSVVVWDVLSGTKVLEAEREDFSRVVTVAFASDGLHLAWIERDLFAGMASLSPAEYTHLDQLRLGHTDPVGAVAFNHDGTLLATASGDGISYPENSLALVWEVATGREILSINHPRTVRDVAFDPTGHFLATYGSGSEVLAIMDIAKREFHQSIAIDEGIRVIEFGPRGQLIAAGTGGGGSKHEVFVWDVASGDVVRVFEGIDSSVRSLGFSVDGRFLAVGTARGEIKIYFIETGWVKTLQGHEDDVRAVAFSADGASVLSADANDVIVWDISSEKAVSRTSLDTPYSSSTYTSACFSKDLELLALCSKRGHVYIIRVRDCVQIDMFVHGDSVLAAAFSPDGTLLASAGADATVKLWRVAQAAD